MSAAHGAAAGAGRRERKKREVRYRIVEAGARLILRQGYEDTTVDQIAAAARVAQKTVFNHFPSKSHVLAALADRMLEFTRELLARERAMRAPAAATIADFFGISAELGEKAQPLVRSVVLEVLRTAGTRGPADDVLLEMQAVQGGTMQELRDRVAVVTGAASGIGRALSARLGAEGMKLVLADVEAEPLEHAARELEETGVETLAVRTDVARADSVSALAERALHRFGAVHVVCNNAGVFAGGLSWQAPVSDYEWVLGVNVWGVIHGIRTFVPILMQQDEGHVVNTASMAALTSSPLAGAYYMSKHAVLSLSESLFHELSAQAPHVGISAVCPELISTGIGRAQRNRPPHLARKDGEATAETEVVEGALAGFMSQGAPPAVIADRTLEAIRERRFYVLAPEGDGWREAAKVRLDDLREARNPTHVVPDQLGEPGRAPAE